MKDTINTYFAVLIVTIAGALATMTIVHLAFEDTPAIVLVNGSTGYATYIQ